LPFFGLDKVCQEQVLKRVAINDTLLGPLVNIHKGGIQGNSQPPLLDKSLMVERLLGGGKLPWTITNRIEWDGVGVGNTRHDSMERGGVDDWLRERSGDWWGTNSWVKPTLSITTRVMWLTLSWPAERPQDTSATLQQPRID
jgi:hypothetical protein